MMDRRHIFRRHVTVARAALLVAISTLMAGCTAEPAQRAPVLHAINVPPGTHTRPLALRKVVLKIPYGQPIGELAKGFLCFTRTPIEARGGRFDVTDEEFNRMFRQELQRNNYKLVGDPDSLFGDPSLSQADYFIAGLIQNMRVNACIPGMGWGDDYSATASVYLRVEWQLYDPLQRRVVFKTRTAGSGDVKEAMPGGVEHAIEAAFASATRNLLANRKFHSLLTVENTPARTVSYTALRLPGIGIDRSRSFDPVKMQPAVVTVRSPNGHGSGFFISSKGYLLTNRHVVGEAKNVRILLYSGRQLPGEVIRQDSVRDVAVIKVGEDGMATLSLGSKEPAVGAEVYAYGTPLSESLSGTLTKGIISAYRTDKGQRFIQSDVTVQPGNSGGPLLDSKGNVVGITVSGQTRNGVTTGQNFFIPIGSALKSLNIRAAASSS